VTVNTNCYAADRKKKQYTHAWAAKHKQLTPTKTEQKNDGGIKGSIERCVCHVQLTRSRKMLSQEELRGMFPTATSGIVFALYMAMFVAQGLIGRLKRQE